MSTRVRIREETINSILAEFIYKKLSEWLKIGVGEGIIRGKIPDVYLVEHFGVKIVIEAKIGYERISDAEKKCIERLESGIADICLAIAYSSDLAMAKNLYEIKKDFLKKS